MNFKIIHLKKVNSTNSYVMELLKQDHPDEGFVVWADEQTNGRGHGKNTWESEKDKNLACSLVLRPKFIEPSHQFAIAQIISIALCRLIDKYVKGEEVKIKWPNDIYVNDKKIAGILIQNILKGDLIEYSVVGIGININQKEFLSDAPNPVSLVHFTKAGHNVEELLNQLLNEVMIIYSGHARQASGEAVHKTYLSYLYRFGQWAEYKAEAYIFEAMITGIGQYGRLVLKMKDGEKREFDFKEVEFVL